jgi:hypothetical protein
MADVAEDDRVKQACAYLRMLLSRPGDYRARWERLAGPAEPGQIDVPAVARVLGDGGGDGGDDGGGEDSVATVELALAGTALSPETLSRFVTGFGIGPRHADRLREVLRGSPATRVITGDVLPPPELYQPGAPRGYETLALHDIHTLGPDGMPAEHQTIQVIRSTVDGLESYPYIFDTDELTVEVTRGGRVGERIHRLADSVYSVDIELPRPLAAGESALMQVRTTFFYSQAPPPEFRRGLMRTTRDVSMWVTFHPERVPKHIWAARWDRLDHSRVVERDQVEPDGEWSVHRRFDAVDRAIVGFYWEWA